MRDSRRLIEQLFEEFIQHEFCVKPLVFINEGEHKTDVLRLDVQDRLLDNLDVQLVLLIEPDSCFHAD